MRKQTTSTPQNQTQPQGRYSMKNKKIKSKMSFIFSPFQFQMSLTGFKCQDNWTKV